MNVNSINVIGEQKLPWQIKEVSYGVKLLAMTGVVLLAFIVFGALIWMILMFSSSQPRVTVPLLIVFMVSLAFAGTACYAIYKLWPITTAATRGGSKSIQVALTTLGQLFEVSYKNPRARSFNGKGKFIFRETNLEAAGTLPPHIWVQVVVVVVVTVLPLVLFGIGLGIIPALLLAYYIGRSNKVISIPYAAIEKLEVKGCTVTLKCTGEIPNKFKLVVGERDGERLYRELKLHYPQSVTDWAHLL